MLPIDVGPFHSDAQSNNSCMPIDVGPFDSDAQSNNSCVHACKQARLWGRLKVLCPLHVPNETSSGKGGRTGFWQLSRRI